MLTSKTIALAIIAALAFGAVASAQPNQGDSLGSSQTKIVVGALKIRDSIATSGDSRTADFWSSFIFSGIPADAETKRALTSMQFRGAFVSPLGLEPGFGTFAIFNPFNSCGLAISITHDASSGKFDIVDRQPFVFAPRVESTAPGRTAEAFREILKVSTARQRSKPLGAWLTTAGLAIDIPTDRRAECVSRLVGPALDRGNAVEGAIDTFMANFWTAPQIAAVRSAKGGNYCGQDIAQTDSEFLRQFRLVAIAGTKENLYLFVSRLDVSRLVFAYYGAVIGGELTVKDCWLEFM